MQTIRLERSNNCWLAIFPVHSRTAIILGTNRVPTAFTPAAPYELVQSQVQRMNPEYKVN